MISFIVMVKNVGDVFLRHSVYQLGLSLTFDHLKTVIPTLGNVHKNFNFLHVFIVEYDAYTSK